MGGIGVADIQRQMRHVDGLVGEVEQVARPLPGPASAEGDAGLLLEEMQEARDREVRQRRAIGRRQRLAGIVAEERQDAADARIHPARGERRAEDGRVEGGGVHGLLGGVCAKAVIGLAQAAGEDGLVERGKLGGKPRQGLGIDAFRLDQHADDARMFGVDAVLGIGRHDRRLDRTLGRAHGPDAQASLHAGKGDEGAQRALLRPAEEARVEDALGPDQHEPFRAERRIPHAFPPDYRCFPAMIAAAGPKASGPNDTDAGVNSRRLRVIGLKAVARLPCRDGIARLPRHSAYGALRRTSRIRPVSVGGTA